MPAYQGVGLESDPDALVAFVSFPSVRLRFRVVLTVEFKVTFGASMSSSGGVIS